MKPPKKVLVVDDDAIICRIMEMQLTAGGYDVITASDAETGRDYIECEAPDAVVADLGMPGMGGKALCEITDPLKKERPFLTLVVTGRTIDEETEWAGQLHDTKLLEKPYKREKLLGLLDDYFGELRDAG